jgi:hypothetical protein
MRSEQIIAALRRPLIKRLRLRRSTVIMVGLFVVLAGLQAYHNYNKPPSSTTICVGDHCVPATHTGSSSTAHQGQATTTTSDPRPRGPASIPKVIGATAPITAGVTSGTVVNSAMRETSSTTTSAG